MNKTIAFPHPPGKGGPGSFQTRFEKALQMQGWDIVYAADGVLPDVVMVVGGTKQLAWLWKMKRAGVPIVYRLDGINWLHRKLKVSIPYFITAEIRNLLNQIVRKYLTDLIVYQSQFVVDWWKKSGWNTDTPFVQIYNGVDLKTFRPQYDENAEVALLCLEGTLDYSPYAIDLLNYLQLELSNELSIIAYGGFQNSASQQKLHPDIQYKGKLKRAELPIAYQNAIYLSLDVNAACPNTVIEALASGIPIVGYDTGALKELVGDNAGCVVPYGSDPWGLQMPDISALVKAIKNVKQNYDEYALAARMRAEQQFGMSTIFRQYLNVITFKQSDKTTD